MGRNQPSRVEDESYVEGAALGRPWYVQGAAAIEGQGNDE